MYGQQLLILGRVLAPPQQYLAVDGRRVLSLDIPKTGLEDNFTRAYYSCSGRAILSGLSVAWNGIRMEWNAHRVVCFRIVSWYYPNPGRACPTNVGVHRLVGGAHGAAALRPDGRGAHRGALLVGGRQRFFCSKQVLDGCDGHQPTNQPTNQPTHQRVYGRARCTRGASTTPCTSRACAATPCTTTALRSL